MVMALEVTHGPRLVGERRRRPGEPGPCGLSGWAGNESQVGVEKKTWNLTQNLNSDVSSTTIICCVNLSMFYNYLCLSFLIHKKGTTIIMT